MDSDLSVLNLRNEKFSPLPYDESLRGEEILMDTIIRCSDGEDVSCHAVILAATSPVLRFALEDCSKGDGPAVVLMLDYSREQVDNLLNLLYTGAGEKTHGLDQLLQCLKVETGYITENEDTSTPKVCIVEESAVKEEARDETCTDDNETMEFDYTPDIDLKDTISIQKKVLDEEDNLKTEKKARKQKRVCISTTERLQIVKEDNTKIFDIHVNSELLIKQLNENPNQTIQQMEKDGVPIFDYPCDHCPHIFFSIFKYSDHIKGEHKEMLKDFNLRFRHYKCFGCTKDFLSIKDRRTHIDKFHKGQSNPGRSKIRLVCSHCKEWNKLGAIRGKARYVDHVMKHELGLKGLFCMTCDEKFSENKTLKRHIIKSHLTSSISCPECGHLCEDEAAFKGHNKEIHSQLKSELKKKRKIEHFCDLCAQKFPSTDSFRYHRKRIHGDSTKMFSCETCGKKFVNLPCLNRHAALHGDPTIPCPRCTKLLHTDHYLKRHIKSQHTDKSDLPCHCDQCGKGFLTNQCLQDHMNVHLGLKPYTCRYCSTGFTNRSNCLAHEKKLHPILFTKLTKGTVGKRVKDRDRGLVNVTQEDLQISRRQRVVINEQGHSVVMTPHH